MKTKSKLAKTLLFSTLGVTTLAVTIPLVVSCSSVDTKVVLETKMEPITVINRTGTPGEYPTSDKFVTINGDTGVILKMSIGGGYWKQ